MNKMDVADFYGAQLMESKTGGTLGKKALDLQVFSTDNTQMRILFRNLLKFFPWEIAHTGVHWIVFYLTKEEQTPTWLFIILILPQLMVIAYVISICTRKGSSSIYDALAGTKVRFLKEGKIQ